MITDNLRQKAKELEQAKDALTEAIMDQMGHVAREHGVEQMMFYVYSNYKRDGKEVECLDLDELDEFFSDHVHPNGFIASWDNVSGWN